MLLVSIDGACRRNGKPNCVSAAGVFIQHMNDSLETVCTSKLSTYEVESTNQRGELLALSLALDYINGAEQFAYIVTDSEYLFNAITKEWYDSWHKKGWKTSTGDDVKNKDLWQSIRTLYHKCKDKGIELFFYHIKGHCIPFGKVTASSLLSQDTSGASLLKEVYKKYDAVCDTTKKANLEQANVLSLKNNGFALPADKLRQFVVSNVMADAIATECVEAADALL